MSAPPATPPPRPTAWLVLVTAAATLWFALCFFVAFPAGVLWLERGHLWPPAGATRVAGAALIVAAHALLVPPIVDFVRRGGGTHAPPLPPRRLVVRGLYTRVRNPMYLLYGAIVVGEALLYRSPALVGYALGFAALAHAYVVRVEEPRLERRFGDAYRAYCRSVPRWLPFGSRRTLPVAVSGSASTGAKRRGTL